MIRLLLISMPWAIFNRPSIQLGALKGYLDNRFGNRVTVRCCHPYLRIAASLGLDNYRLISKNPWAAEALYCGLLFPERKQPAEQVFNSFIEKTDVTGFTPLLQVLETTQRTWLEQLEDEKYDLIGFTVCFSQLPASLYAARALKKKWPHIPIVFGGSTCSPALGRGLLSVFPDIDYVITGEGEQPLADLLLHLSEDKKIAGKAILARPGRSFQDNSFQKHHEIQKLSSLPPPDYDDYFLEMKQGGLDFNPVLPLEFSRGCWWNKCTFCNLNLQWQGYRYKKSDQILDELKSMVNHYHCIDFTFTDNALPIKEADRFFEATAADELDYRFFGELRTLSKPESYHLYAQGGLRSVQIGIEALSDPLLKRMCKGTSVMDNIAAMKFAQTAGMTLDGNLILEFPDSTEQEVEETLQVLDKVLPFRPLSAATFFLGQQSPICNQPGQHGIKAIVQHPINRKLYPSAFLGQLEMLIRSYRGDRTLQAGRWKPVRDKIARWHGFHANRSNPCTPPLTYRDGSTFLIIRQEVPEKPVLHHRLRGLSRTIYLACHQPVTRKQLLSRFSQVTKEQLDGFLADLERKNLVYCNETSCIALAVPAS